MPGAAIRRSRAIIYAVFTLLLFPAALHAAPPAAPPAAPSSAPPAAPPAAPWHALPSAASRAEVPWSRDGRDLVVSVVTMGPGDHPFLKFGHDAIWLHDRTTGRDALYNFGTFAFTRTLIQDFMKGRLEYWLSVQSLSSLSSYEEANRSIVIQPLRLDAAAKSELAASLTVNALPENKAYKYDYYRDNCATRVRDAIDRSLGGQLRRATEGDVRDTYRSHTLRLVADELWLYLALDLALARDADLPLRQWDELFLPEKVEAALARLVVNEAGQPPHPLVQGGVLAFRADRPAPRRAPPNWLPQALALGILTGGALFALGTWGVRRRAARSAFLLLSALGGVFFGFLGSVFAIFWCFTDHSIAHRNENLLQCSPHALLLAFAALVALLRPGRGERSVFYLAAASAGLALSGLLAKVLPSFIQSNGIVIAFALPLWLGMAGGAWALRGPAVSPRLVARSPA